MDRAAGDSGTHRQSPIWPLVAGGLSLVTLASLCCVLALVLFGLPPSAVVIAGILAVSVAPGYALYLLLLDPLEHEPPWLLALALAWGAGLAVLVGGATTLLLEFTSGLVLGLSAEASDALGTALFAPVTEEIAKGLFVLLLFLLARHEFDDIADGIVYGGLVGLGFAVIEDVLYYAENIVEEGLASTGVLFLLRGVLTGFGHPLYTAMTGLGLGLAVQVRSGLLRWLLVPSGLVLAILLHAAWNGAIVLAQLTQSDVLALAVLLGYPALVLLPGALFLGVVAFVQARRRSRDVMRFLTEAVQRGLADPADLDVLPRPWRRRGRQLETLWRFGWRAFWLRRRLDIARVDWAYRCWHRAQGRRLPKYLASFDAEALERRIHQWRAELAQIQHAAAR